MDTSVLTGEYSKIRSCPGQVCVSTGTVVLCVPAPNKHEMTKLFLSQYIATPISSYSNTSKRPIVLSGMRESN